MRRAIILFTRVPVAGQTKTRLMPFLSGEACAALHSGFIRSAARACRGVDADVLVYYAQKEGTRPSGKRKNQEAPLGNLAKLIKEARGFYPQKGDGLGERMSQAFAEVFAMGYERVLLSGTDIPQITADIFRQSFRDLEGCDAVINPTEDGGYYLIGLRNARDDIWDVPHYGTNTVFDDTLYRLERAGLRVCAGQMLRDIDTKEDLEAWYGSDRCIHCKMCTRNCRFLEKYGIDLAGMAERPELAYSCFMCGRCKAVCPKDIDGARIAVLMRQMYSDRASYKGLLWEKSPYKFANYRKGRRKSVLFPGCNFTAFFPETTKYLECLMRKHGIGVIYDCCGKPVYELGLRAESEDNLERIACRLGKLGVEELVVLCPNCYYFLKDRLEVPVVTVYEKLKELGEGKPVERERIPIYYPCPDRDEKAVFRDICQYLDGEASEPFEKVQCCGLGGAAGVKEPELSQDMAESAMVSEDVLYTYCASCISNFRRRGMEAAYHILPLILGIEEEVPLGIRPFMNRARRKLL
ncbi:2-phospho-L-lactate guanylyltransferase [Lachnospiraceae bacterium]|jgi:rSAM/selenodomain-associated transferase 1|nr:2-phospho-L-lactate guanylyltransferase [Lachnospiraceae bacterium]